jgi:HEAT repeat protein
MDSLLSQLLTLVHQGTVEQRCAALLVLAALKLDNAQVVKAVGAAVAQPNPVLKDFALRYFEEVKPQSALPLFAGLLDDPDKDTHERAVRFLSQAGQAAVPAVLQFASGAARSGQINASRAGQVNAARVLCELRGKAAFKGLLQMLVGGTDEFNKTICDLMTPAVRGLDDKEQEQLYGEVETLAAKLDPKEQRPAAVSAMRLMGQLGRAEARRWLLKFVTPEHHHTLRAHALVALLRCLRDHDLRKEEYAKLFPLLEEAEFSEITRLAIDLLDAHELPDDSRHLLSRLLESPHPDVQKFALRKMADFSTPATVRTLIEQLGDPDYRKRDVAANSLRKIPEARAALLKELAICSDASKAWSIAELLPSFEGKWRHDVLIALWKRLHGAIGAEDRIQTAFLQVLKLADPNYSYEQLAAEAARLAKAKKFKEAAAFLTPLKDFSEFKPEDKFRLALAQLKLHAHTLSTNRQHPTVELLSDLHRNSAFPLFETLRKERSLEAEDLFHLGFSLVERHGGERSLGKDLLEHVAAKFPRNKIGKNAKNKLKLISW